jgi:hypothetical protein
LVGAVFSDLNPFHKEGDMAGIKKVRKEIVKGIFSSKNLPEELKTGSILKMLPDREKFYFSGKKAEVVRKLVNREYMSNEELRKDLKEIGFDLAWAPLAGANLSGLDLSRTDLTGADLTSANLSYAKLFQAIIMGKVMAADFSGADLGLANLSLAEATNANFTNANLSAANLSGSRLISAKFLNANLASADLSDTNLTDADFSGASLSGANLQNAIVKGTVFEHGLQEKKDYLGKEKKYGENYKPPGKVGSDETPGGMYEKKDEYRKKGPYPK